MNHQDTGNNDIKQNGIFRFWDKDKNCNHNRPPKLKHQAESTSSTNFLLRSCSLQSSTPINRLSGNNDNNSAKLTAHVLTEQERNLLISSVGSSSSSSSPKRDHHSYLRSIITSRSATDLSTSAEIDNESNYKEEKDKNLYKTKQSHHQQQRGQTSIEILSGSNRENSENISIKAHINNNRESFHHPVCVNGNGNANANKNAIATKPKSASEALGSQPRTRTQSSSQALDFYLLKTPAAAASSSSSTGTTLLQSKAKEDLRENNCCCSQQKRPLENHQQVVDSLLEGDESCRGAKSSSSSSSLSWFQFSTSNEGGLNKSQINNNHNSHSGNHCSCIKSAPSEAVAVGAGSAKLAKVGGFAFSSASTSGFGGGSGSGSGSVCGSQVKRNQNENENKRSITVRRQDDDDGEQNKPGVKMSTATKSQTVRLIPAYFIAELVGTFLLVVIGDGAIGAYVLTKRPMDVFCACFAFGVGAMIASYASARISGAHINPAATFAFALNGQLKWSLVPVYLVGQYVGGFLAAMVLFVNYSEAINSLDGGQHSAYGASNSTGGIFATYPANYVTIWGSLLDQIVGTAVLLFSICAVTDKSNHGLEEKHQPLVVAFVIGIICVAFSPNCGAIFNPARDLPPRLVTFLFGYPSVWAPLEGTYWLLAGVLGPHIGAILGVFGYKYTIGYALRTHQRLVGGTGVVATAVAHIEALEDAKYSPYQQQQQHRLTPMQQQHRH